MYFFLLFSYPINLIKIAIKNLANCCNCLSPLQGYTIPLDKRLAADGRGLQTVHINENFAKLAEALYIADRKVRWLFKLLCFMWFLPL